MRNRSNPGHLSKHRVGLNTGLCTGMGTTQRLSESTTLFFLSNSSHFFANGPSSKFKSSASFLTTRIAQLVAVFEER